MKYEYVHDDIPSIALIDGDIILHRCMYGLDDNDEHYEIWKKEWHNLVVDTAESCFADEYHLFVSGSKNFRDAARKNRGEIYKRAKAYIGRKHLHKNTYISVNREADDSIASAWYKCPHRAIIASTDKDLKQLSGVHYNISTRKFSTVTKDQAKKNFCRQMLWGDSVDNIPGLAGIGEVKSLRILNSSDKPYIESVMDAYKVKHGQEWETHFQLMGDLLWLQRLKGQRFNAKLLNEDKWF